MHIDFEISDNSTLGVEWEVALVDRDSGELAQRAQEVLEAVVSEYPELGEEGDHPQVTGEFLQNTVEMVTGVCQNVPEALEHLSQTQDRIREVTDPRGLEIFAAGTHPFSDWADQPVVDAERYYKVLDRAQYWGRQMVIFGLHVHVGVDHRDKALPVLDGLMNYYPHLLALSANSPYWCGHDTGYASQRAQLFQQLSTAGLPFHFDSWDEYEAYVADLIATDVIEETSENRWDIRPVPRFGTVEMRVCDGPSNLREVGALTALTQCLVESFSRTLDEGGSIPVMPPWHHQENKWRAARYGLDAVVIKDAQNHQTPLTEDLTDVLNRLEPLAAELGCAQELAYVETMMSGEAGYLRQRRIAQENGGDLRAVVRDIVAQNREIR
ncbi:MULTISPECIES: glutamate--cysteine ligase [Kocuria]|uniref:Putative glutamate--cysteine ligase 2 n=1 Tax=Kocuria rhizophila TaxID=72000 RepID=A0AAX2SH33_KOCRH|nr:MULTISPECIES: glutamate--cysteine ligase [Kocuria]WIW69081.1 glutamate--cysteine ligase [Kocuria sp. ChxB]KIC67042.1 carboxylate--amine ligase [Kocuria rhizophila]MCT1456351.1 glutamate--cysteine ligase [Kocuria rhizophila]MCT1880483.1 glutamate--cysteine ligase [Kocuria rhizophila]MCT2250259.1 glutamate--cysteine ligase [Kocuria rhizophila]